MELVTEPVIHTWTWWQSGGVSFGVGTYIDGLAVMMLLAATTLVTVVQRIRHVERVSRAREQKKGSPLS
jgi:NADH:ubiquinone oxidoreductase subunit 5 (subunit L)/multisubunit Na+/H+ antiporter MnhA subunit